MEMNLVKPEAGSGSRSLCNVETDISMTKCVKRRRRSPSLAQGVEPQQSKPPGLPLADPPTAAATTTTVKRSSRFRGVSRSNSSHTHTNTNTKCLNANFTKQRCVVITDIGGPDDTKLICGTKGHGM